MTNHRQTRTGFAYARLWRSAVCVVICISCFAIARLIASPSYVLVTNGEKDIGYIGENGEFVPFEKNKNSIDASQNIQSRPRYTATTPQIQPQQPKPTAQFQNYSDVVTASQVDIYKAGNSRKFLKDVKGEKWVAVQEAKVTGETCQTKIEPINIVGNAKPANAEVKVMPESERCMDTQEPRIPYETFALAVMSTKDLFAGSDTEINLLVLKSKMDEKYYVGYKSRFTDVNTAKIAAPGHGWIYIDDKDRAEFNNKFNIVASVHNHPDTRHAEWEKYYKEYGEQIHRYKEAFFDFLTLSQWFSNMDAIAAKDDQYDCVMYSQAADKFFWLHSTNGEVTNLENENLEFPGNGLHLFMFSDIRLKDGRTGNVSLVDRVSGYGPHDAYNPKTWDNEVAWGEMLECKAGFKSEKCGGVDFELEMIGVRGWCHCWDKEPLPIGGLVKGGIGCVGDGNLYEMEQTCDGDYFYTICARCGRCFTTKKPGEKCSSDLHDDIIDARMYRKWHKKAGSDIPFHQFEKHLREARDVLLKIPDGGIVISGVCHCKNPDPVSVNVLGDEFYVCCFCGKVRLPDEIGNIPIGPTLWRILKGEDKPFPGFTKANK